MNSHTSDSHTNKTTTELAGRIPRKSTHQQGNNNDTDDKEKNSRPEVEEASTSNTTINLKTTFDSETTQPQTKATHNTSKTMEHQHNKQDERNTNPEDSFDPKTPHPQTKSPQDTTETMHLQHDNEDKPNTNPKDTPPKKRKISDTTPASDYTTPPSKNKKERTMK